MPDYHTRIIEDIETHSVDAIGECFQNGVSSNAMFRGEPLLHELTSEYGRGPSFRQCVRVFVDHGLKYDNAPLLAVLLDDATMLLPLIEADQRSCRESTTCAVPTRLCWGQTLLHICAEFNHVECAKVLIAHGAKIDAVAGVDESGLGGQDADLPYCESKSKSISRDDGSVAGTWSRSVADREGARLGADISLGNPHPSGQSDLVCHDGLATPDAPRRAHNFQVVQQLMKHAHGIVYELKNVPNVYLKGGN